MDAMLDYSKYGYTPELNGIETIDGKDAYKVTLTSKSGTKTINYYLVDYRIVS